MAGPTDCNLDFFYCLEWQLSTLLMQGSHFSYSKDSKKSKKGKKKIYWTARDEYIQKCLNLGWTEILCISWHNCSKTGYHLNLCEW